MQGQDCKIIMCQFDISEIYKKKNYSYDYNKVN